VDQTIARLRATGTTVARAPVDMPWGERVGFVWDPAGNLVVLAAPSRAEGSSRGRAAV